MQKGSCFIPEVSTEKPSDTTGMQSVPPEKKAAMITYAKQLKKKFPHMKEQRIMKKVAEYFKVKLV